MTREPGGPTYDDCSWDEHELLDFWEIPEHVYLKADEAELGR